MKNKNIFMKRLLTVCLIIAFQCSYAQEEKKEDSPEVKEIKALMTRVQAKDPTIEEKDMIKMLRMSMRLGRPHSASQSIKIYMKSNQDLSKELFLYSAEVAELAGDLLIAVSRYKAYLNTATGEAGSNAAARMYHIMIYYISSHEDAYDFWKKNYSSFRESRNARKYDHFFIKFAIKSEDYPTAISTLKDFISQADAKDKNLYYKHVISLTHTLLNTQKGKGKIKLGYAAKLAELAALMPNDWRKDFVNLSVSYMKFAKGYKKGKKGGHAKDFTPVLNQAKQWFNKQPSLVTARKVYEVFSPANNHTIWRQGEIEKRKFFHHVWDRTDEYGKQVMMRNIIGNTSRILENYWHKDLNKYKWLADSFNASQAASFLKTQNLGSIRSIARKRYDNYLGIMTQGIAVSSNPIQAFDAMMVNGGYKWSPNTVYQVIYQYPWFEAHQKAHKRKDLKYFLIKHYWLKYHTKSSAALLDVTATSKYMKYMWDQRKGDYAEMNGIISALNWVPYSTTDRDRVFGVIKKDFDRWKLGASKKADYLQKKAKKTPKEMADLRRSTASVQSIPKLNSLLKRIIIQSIYKKSAAPNSETNLARNLHLAIKTKDAAKVEKAAGDLYNAVKGGKTAFRYSTVRWATRYGSFNHQIKLLNNEITRLKSNVKDDSGVNAVLAGMKDKSADWPTRVRSGKKDQAKKVNTALTDGLRACMAKGSFHTSMFYWIFSTTRGSGWNESGSMANAIGAEVIKGDWFTKANSRPIHGGQSYSVNYLRLTREYLPGLRNQFPASYFDDMFIKESACGYLSPDYWLYGKDENGKIARLVVSIRSKGQYPFVSDSRWNEVDVRGGAKVMNAFYKQQYDAGKGLNLAALGWNKLRYQDLNSSTYKKGRADYFKALDTYVYSAGKHQDVFSAPSLSPIYKINPKNLTKDELESIVRMIKGPMDFNRNRRDYRGLWSYMAALKHIQFGLTKAKRHADLLRTMPTLWRILIGINEGGKRDILFNLMATAIENFSKNGNIEMAVAISNSGVLILRGSVSSRLKNAFNAAKSQAINDLGEIPVPNTDPRYKLYLSQRSYISGNKSGAWTHFLEAEEILTKTFKEFDLEYLTWIVRHYSKLGEYEKATALARLFVQWVELEGKNFGPIQRGMVFLSLADISFEKEDYPVARARYESIRTAPEFKDSIIRFRAALRTAEVDRKTAAYDQAQSILMKLMVRPEREIQVGALYQLVLLNMEPKNEDFKEALKIVDKVLLLEPDHDDALIQKAKINLALKKLEHVLSIEIGPGMAKRVIVPGRLLTVKLEDKNLAIIGASTSIEIRAWTSSGDEEFFNLYPWADSKTVFKGNLATVLGAPNKKDNVLQLLGDDEVHYDFSEEFKKRNNIVSAQTITLRVKTDSTLEASASRILTEEEKEDQKIRKMLQSDRELLTVQTIRKSAEVRPGNNIFIRVNDPDRSTTIKQDAINVTISTSSGDEINRSVMFETKGASGIFENIVKTAKAQAVAYASDSGDGRLANFVISKKKYPAWVGHPDGSKPKMFWVDMNDNVPLDKMTMISNEPGHKLKDFMIQSSLDNKNFHTLGVWPAGSFKHWNGRLELEITKAPVRNNRADSFSDDDYLDWRYKVHGFKKATLPRKEYKFKLNRELFTSSLSALDLGRGGKYIARLRGALYMSKRQTRIFTMKHSDIFASDDFTMNMMIDGEEVYSIGGGGGARSREDEDAIKQKNTFRASLEKGVHLVELWITADVNKEFAFEMLINTKTDPFVGKIPKGMYDINKHPEIKNILGIEPAIITATAGDTAFNVKFGKRSNARVVRVVIMDYEGQAPAINKINLVNRKGEVVLPTPTDFQELKKNDTLEIIAGDKVTIKYTDPKVLSDDKKEQEVYLNVSYYNANLSASFIEYVSRGSLQTPFYVPIVRFKVGEPIVIFIQDADADTTPKADQVTVEVSVGGKKPVTIKALETAPQSGSFTAKIFPIEPIEGESKRVEDIQIAEDDNILITYLDKENTDPGIPWLRKSKVTQVYWQDPEIRGYSVKVKLIEPEIQPKKDG
ncbi:MAG: hypothetical protein HRT89_10325, partial [Lentisphaeria bacterium]|nr:hypothetical protein [Lentisphaeria bacterium]